MGFKRFIEKRINPFYYTKNIIDKVSENGLAGGFKELLREDLEDTPILSGIYKVGRDEGFYEGKKDGYNKASFEYENKLLKQADEFLKQKKLYQNNSKEKDRLLNEYEDYIMKMEAKIEQLTSEQRGYLRRIYKSKEELLRHA